MKKIEWKCLPPFGNWPFPFAGFSVYGRQGDYRGHVFFQESFIFDYKVVRNKKEKTFSLYLWRNFSLDVASAGKGIPKERLKDLAFLGVKKIGNFFLEDEEIFRFVISDDVVWKPLSTVNLKGLFGKKYQTYFTPKELFSFHPLQKEDLPLVIFSPPDLRDPDPENKLGIITLEKAKVKLWTAVVKDDEGFKVRTFPGLFFSRNLFPENVNRNVFLRLIPPELPVENIMLLNIFSDVWRIEATTETKRKIVKIRSRVLTELKETLKKKIEASETLRDFSQKWAAHRNEKKRMGLVKKIFQNPVFKKYTENHDLQILCKKIEAWNNWALSRMTKPSFLRLWQEEAMIKTLLKNPFKTPPGLETEEETVEEEETIEETLSPE